MLTLKEKVAKGVRWLNENHPNWKKEVDVSRLDMTEYDSCILGQMFDDYENAEKVLGRKFCEDYGFIDPDDWREAKELTQEWLNVLEETYNLSVNKVDLGLYEVVRDCFNPKYSVGDRVLVVDLHNYLVNFTYAINYVVNLDSNRVYVNCPIVVKKVLDKIDS